MADEQAIEQETEAFEAFGDGKMPGVLLTLGELPGSAIISIGGLAQLSRRHEATVRRAITRGELPPTTKLFGASVWFVDTILKHLEARLEDARKEAQKTAQRLQTLIP